METNANQSDRIRHEQSKSPVNVSRVYKSDFQKEGTMTAELKQTVTTKSFYPTKSVSNSLNGNIFSMEDYGFQEQEFNNTETRVAWIDVPVGSTDQTVVAKLQNFPEAGLHRILSNRPIIADTEEYAINSSELEVTLDTFAERQAVRYPNDHPEAGQLALDTKGKIQYRRIVFSTVKSADQDLRTEDPSDFYASASLKAELNSVVHTIPSQTL